MRGVTTASSSNLAADIRVSVNASCDIFVVICPSSCALWVNLMPKNIGSAHSGSSRSHWRIAFRNVSQRLGFQRSSRSHPRIYRDIAVVHLLLKLHGRCKGNRGATTALSDLEYTLLNHKNVLDFFLNHTMFS